MQVVGDWGSTRLRLYLIDGARIVAKREGPGIKSLDRSPADVLADLTQGWAHDGPIRLCGMVGARGGCVEVPYAPCPVDPRNLPVTTVAGVEIVHGVRTAPGTRPDVMRGEETQIAGALRRDERLTHGNQLVVLPGTHSKWVRLADGSIVDFRTIMTGELFAVLGRHSLLIDHDVEPDETGFEAGMAALRTTAPLTDLFVARSAQLLDGRTAGWARGYLSGLLIGSEVGEALRWADVAAVTLIGDPLLMARYQRVLSVYGVASQTVDGADAVIAGLVR